MVGVLELFQNYDVNFLLAQLVGLVTAILAIFSVQLKDMKHVLIMGVFTKTNRKYIEGR